MAAPILLTLTGVRTGPQTVGDMLRLGIVVKNPATGDEVDPTTVRFKHLPPDERTPTTLVYGTDTALVKSDIGVYHTNLTLAESGVYAIRWEAAGNYVGAAEFSLTVAPTQF